MDEPQWYENMPFSTIKSIIQTNINNASLAFVKIGYYLKNVRDRELYIEDGYKSIWEFAQVEFNISQSWANRWMLINDRFSKDGNSPILLERYREYSSSKLSEMLSLTDEQLEQVTLTTTRAEIRDMKKVNKVYAHAHKETDTKEDAPIKITYEPVNKELAISIARWCIGYLWDVLSPMVGEKGLFDFDFSETLEEKLAKHKNNTFISGNDTIEFNKAYIKVTNQLTSKVEYLLYSDVSLHMRSTWNAKAITELEKNQNLEVDLMDIEEDEQLETVLVQPNVNEAAIRVDEESEIIEADVIQTPIDNGVLNVIELLNDCERKLYEYTCVDCPPKLLAKQRIYVEALRLLAGQEHEQITKEQLPISLMKNNDQRKEFIDNYIRWPIWIDTKETGERYYRYDFDNGTSFVIRVSLCHKYIGWKEGYSKDAEYGREEYFLLSPDKCFIECQSNKSAMIEYLKEMQKK